MKLIFLDIDGVLATEECSQKPHHKIFAYPFDAECVSVLNDILRETNAEIILSSDWRLMYNNDLTILDELFKHNGVIKSPIDVTPSLRKGQYQRQAEIQNYINSNTEKIKSFVILDDALITIFPENFVKCNLTEGVKEKGLQERVVEILSKPPYMIHHSLH